MANKKSQDQSSAPVRDAGPETRNPGARDKKPVGGGAISQVEQKSGGIGGEGRGSQQSNADADGPSRQTSTAQDEQGQV